MGVGHHRLRQGQLPPANGLHQTPGDPAEWVGASLPFALDWAEGNEAIPGFPVGNVEGLKQLGREASEGRISEVTAAVLRDFAIRLGARRRADTADAMGAFPSLAEPLSQQAAVIGAAQISVIDAEWGSFAQHMEDAAALHLRIVEALRTLV